MSVPPTPCANRGQSPESSPHRPHSSRATGKHSPDWRRLAAHSGPGRPLFSMDIAYAGGMTTDGTFTYVDHVLKGSVQSTEILGIEVVDDEL